MLVRHFCLLFTAAASLAAADRKLPIEDTSNEQLDISGSLIQGKEQIEQALGVKVAGNDLDNIIVVSVKVRPLCRGTPRVRKYCGPTML